MMEGGWVFDNPLPPPPYVKLREALSPSTSYSPLPSHSRLFCLFGLLFESDALSFHNTRVILI
jgi:hypothetical protein